MAKRCVLTIGEHGQPPDLTREFSSKSAAVHFAQDDTDMSDLSALRLFRTGQINLDERNSGLDTGGRPDSWYAKIELIQE